MIQKYCCLLSFFFNNKFLWDHHPRTRFLILFSSSIPFSNLNTIVHPFHYYHYSSSSKEDMTDDDVDDSDFVWMKSLL